MGWRTITIDGIPYAWQSRTEDRAAAAWGGGAIRIIVRRTDTRGACRMVTHFDEGNLVTPYLVRHAIEQALANGWRADLPGPLQTFRTSGVLPDRRVAVPPRPPADRDEGELLDAIWTAEDPRAARLVYADWLLEQGDPRGELIALANTPDLDARATARLAELVAARTAWLGPIASVVHHHTWEHGMLAHAQLGKRQPGAVDRARGHGGWITLHSLDATGHRMRPEESVSIAAHPIMRNLRVLQLGTAHLFGFEATLPRVEELYVTGRAPELGARILDVFPALRLLVALSGTALELARLVELEVASTIHTIDAGLAVFAQLPKFADQVPDDVRELAFTNHMYGTGWSGPRVGVTRGTDGRWSAIAVSWTGADWPPGRAFVERAFAELPQDAVTAIAIDRARVPDELARFLAQAAARRDVPVTG